ncbi:hypothetical protein I5Q34_07545 [Streptomyces sp. AV19]|uniref:hypothetical protein n=1 Tax=Streptomyces sp. AV19 TaxID=2793068 RepID=UPI0018FF0FB5|nr:hypothetical protein [Streptomyces sp. AV19]MBH1934150.1 hypothetical protein [Streptomyces sp. AV19]MDG4533675.1 hypothetical protein [Streptomyces sp. AV19]
MTVDTLLGEQLPQRAAGLGDVLVRAVTELAVPGVRLETIGRGLMTGVRIAAAPGGDRAAFTRSVVRRMRDLGVIALRGGTDGAVVKWTPPLTIPEDELLRSVSVLGEALTAEADSTGSDR